VDLERKPVNNWSIGATYSGDRVRRFEVFGNESVHFLICPLALDRGRHLDRDDFDVVSDVPRRVMFGG
jgi:hypothetical protein